VENENVDFDVMCYTTLYIFILLSFENALFLYLNSYYSTNFYSTLFTTGSDFCSRSRVPGPGSKIHFLVPNL